MTLLIDLGNSRIKWATLERNTGEPSGVFEHHGQLAEVDLDQITGASQSAQDVVCAAVADQSLIDALSDHFRTVWQRDIDYVTAGDRCMGLVNGYRQPSRLGVDRWLAMLAARAQIDGGFCLIDAGTAITVDRVDEHGQHLGGWIVPGERLMYKALVANTGQIKQGFDPTGATWGQSTAAAVTLGARAAVAGMVAEMEKRLFQTGGDRLQIVVTGGGGSRIIEHLSEPALLVPDLVLDGLALWTHNRRNK